MMEVTDAAEDRYEAAAGVARLPAWNTGSVPKGHKGIKCVLHEGHGQYQRHQWPGCQRIAQPGNFSTSRLLLRQGTLCFSTIWNLLEQNAKKSTLQLQLYGLLREHANQALGLVKGGIKSGGQ